MDVLATHHPSLLVRRRSLDTIKEESESSGKSDSEGSGSDRTIVGKPAGWNPHMYVAAPRKSSRLSSSFTPSSPASSASASPCSSTGTKIDATTRSSYTLSDIGTVFSDESCPSLASDPTTFATESSRNSVASSTKQSRNRYPALLIPRGSWSSLEGSIKEIPFGMSPKASVVLSPEALSQLSELLPPGEHEPPSLGNSSLASSSPCLAQTSAPGTPDSRLLDVVEGEAWGQPQPNPTLLEIALDEHHSIVISPAGDLPASANPLSAGVWSPLRSARDNEWGEMVTRFPGVPRPNLHPSNVRTLAPQNRRLDILRTTSTAGSDAGVVLPKDALQVLQRITRPISPDRSSFGGSSKSQSGEMRELTDGGSLSRSRSLDGITPATEGSIAKLSEYSFTQLSIPSPGGFFSSLQAGSRQTWCLNRSVENSMPTSAVAESFYFNWQPMTRMRETSLSIPDGSDTEGPPTAKRIPQSTSGATITDVTELATLPAPRSRSPSLSTADEDADMYGPGSNEPSFAAPAEIEYEEAYDEEIKQTAEQNLDRTSNWLAAQTTYLSALRDHNPANKPEDYAPSPQPPTEDDNTEEGLKRSASVAAHIQKTVRFLEAARASSPPALSTSPGTKSDGSPSGSDTSATKSPLFYAAFEHFLRQNGSRDTFLHAAARVEAVRAGRVATPARHIDSIANRMDCKAADKPKYSGPFSGNPRATGIFDRTPASLAFEATEREQRAMQSVQHSAWHIEALRTTFGGRLFASRIAHERLRTKATISLSDPKCIGTKRYRILDLGGDSNASWGWTAAHEYANVKVYTVVTKEQASQQRPADVPRPSGPENHRTVSVPYLWQLPFKPNHFDAISARSLHALLKSNPVPGAPEIDEWSLTLKECLRCLKPGGYLDFIVMDSYIARAGPRGEALSVEFSFDLHRRGYDRNPAHNWLRRLKKEGFISTKRAWMFWPIGRKPEVNADGEQQGARAFLPAPRPVSEVSTISKIVRQYMDVEAVQGPVGSTQDAADVTGLLGTRMYEEWLVKVRREAGREKGRLLEGIDEVLEEGKANAGGFRVLVGWARKPRVKSCVIEKALVQQERKVEVEMVDCGRRWTDQGQLQLQVQQQQQQQQEVSPLKEEIQIGLDQGDGVFYGPGLEAGVGVGVAR